MFEVSVKERFSAAHRLKGYPGKCAAVHGHNWEVEVFVRGPELNDIGILLDFNDVRSELRSLIEELDHQDLSSIRALEGKNPTSENLARYIYERMSEQVGSEQLRVSSVLVRETPESCARYWEEAEGGM